MPWSQALIAAGFLIVGVLIILNASALSENIHSAQQRYLPFARPNDRIDRAGLLGPITPGMRAWSIRGVGTMAVVMAVLVVVHGFATSV